MSYSATFKTGRVRAAQTDVAFKPRTIRGASKRGVILVHGKGVPREWLDGGGGTTAWASAEIGPRLAAAGIPSVAAEMSGDSFANDASMTDMSAARTLLGTMGCSIDKVHLLGVSMGGAVSLRWAGANPTLVASIAGVMPLVDVKALYDNNTAGLRAAAGTAWGVTYPTAIPAGANLPTNSYPAIVSAGIPWRGYYTTSDTTILPATVTAAATALGGTAIDVGGALNHTEYTMKLFNDGWFDSYINWIKGLGA
jgi:pimeloyl-ACP methyl ester carboxylesterase